MLAESLNTSDLETLIEGPRLLYCEALDSLNDFDLLSQHRYIVIEHLKETLRHAKRVILTLRSHEQDTLSEQRHHRCVSIQNT